MAVPNEAVDIHVHAGPSFFERKHDAIELAERVRDSDMGGVVLKSHFGNTYVPSKLATNRVAGIEIHPSLTLNSFVGGLNPTAVEHAFVTNVRIIWLPTFSAANFPVQDTDRFFPFSNQSISVLDSDGNACDELRAVLEAIADGPRPVALGNGHLSRQETFTILDVLEEMGIDVPYLVTHADFDFMGLSFDDQIALAERGAYIEKCYLPLMMGDTSVEEMVLSIDDIGPERCVLSTDHGQQDNASPPDAYATFLNTLEEAGIDSPEIRQMAVETPRTLLNLTMER